jgi:protein TonB
VNTSVRYRSACIVRFRSEPPQAAAEQRPIGHECLRLRLGQGPAVALLRAARRLRSTGHVRLLPARAESGTPRIALDALVCRLRERPALSVVACAILGACIVHLVLGASGLAARPGRRTAARVQMTVAPAAVDEVVSEPSPPAKQVPAAAGAQPSPPRSASTRAAAAMPALPAFAGTRGGPFIPGLGVTPAAAAQGASATRTHERVMGAKVLSRVAPRYPLSARQRGIEGKLVLDVLVDARGNVKAIKVVQSDPAGVFDQAGIDALRAFSFAPATRDDVAVESWVRQVLRFDLETT